MGPKRPFLLYFIVLIKFYIEHEIYCQDQLFQLTTIIQGLGKDNESTKWSWKFLWEDRSITWVLPARSRACIRI
jgi:hypothetical protein